jgi:hypothetical protein
MNKNLKLSLVIGLILLGCNTTEEGHSEKNTTKVKTTSTEKSNNFVLFFAKEGNASTITIPLDQNDKKLQEEIKAYYEKYFSDKLEKALASSQNLHNPTFDPLIEAFPFAIRSTSFYKNAESELSKKGYSIKNEMDFEKFHTVSEKGSYAFHFSPASLEASLNVEKNSNLLPYACREIIDVKLTPYFTKRKHFIKYNECMSYDDSLIINSKTKQSIDLTGYATAIKKFSLADKEILQINSHMGAHTNGVSFFFIEKNGDLTLMENGFMASDVGDPKVVVTNRIEVKTQYTRDKNLCRYLLEDTFKYDNKKRAFIKTKSAVETMSECADE